MGFNLSPTHPPPSLEEVAHISHWSFKYSVLSVQDHQRKQSVGVLQSKYSARSAHYLGMIFITRERIALLESKFHFQIEDQNLPTVDSFEITNVDWVVTCINQKFTHEIRNRWQLLVSIGLHYREFFSIFRNISWYLQQPCF